MQDSSAIRKRQRFGFALAGLVTAGYAALILLIAFLPEILARPVAPGRALTNGLLWGIVYSLSTIVVMGVYVRHRTRADRS